MGFCECLAYNNLIVLPGIQQVSLFSKTVCSEEHELSVWKQALQLLVQSKPLYQLYISNYTRLDLINA
jgi:hypothetical protein